jgi:hypothetical protein
MIVDCGLLSSEPDLCQRAVAVAEERVPAAQQPPLAVVLSYPQTFSVCPPSVSYDAAHPDRCVVVAHVTTGTGAVEMVLKLSPPGWVFLEFMK